MFVLVVSNERACSRNVMADLLVEVVENLNDFERFRAPWTELLEKSAANNIFLTWEWLKAWSEEFLNDQRELFVVIVYEGNSIVAIAPWYVRKVTRGMLSVRQIEFLGTPEAGSDYLDVIAKKGKEKEVARYLYSFLLGDAAERWDRLRLHDVPSNSLFSLHFLNRIREDGKYAAVSDASYCPFSILPPTEEAFFSGLSSRRGQRFRQDLRNLQKQDTIEHLTYSTGNPDAQLDEFFRLYSEKAGWQGDSLKRLIRGYLDLRGEGSIQLDFLVAGGNHVGGLLHLKYGNTLYMYLMAIDKTYNSKVSIGNLLVGLCINNAIGSGIACYDFLKGEEDYKFHWANSGQRTATILFSQRKLLPVCLTLADMARSAAKLILR